MLSKAAFVFAVLGSVVIIGTDFVRGIVHHRRERIRGIGGTQDIAMWGTLITFACYIAAGICGLLWKLQN
jgi:hypothetical protein